MFIISSYNYLVPNISSECSSCVQSICGSGEQCRFIVGPDENCVNTSCGVVGENSIIKCNGTTQSLLNLTSLASIEMGNCAENRTFENQMPLLDIPPGFYIVGNLIRFCSTQCFGRILIGSRSNPNLPSSENPIQFHVYKRYVTDEAGDNDYFVEQQISLNHNSAQSEYEATPRGSSSVCVDRGDYIGFTLTEDIGLVGFDGVASTAGSYINVSLSPQCAGITSQVFSVSPFAEGPIPMISFEPIPGPKLHKNTLCHLVYNMEQIWCASHTVFTVYITVKTLVCKAHQICSIYPHLFPIWCVHRANLACRSHSCFIRTG